MDSIRVMVVDDAADTRMLIRLILEDEQGVEVVAEAASAEAALEQFGDARPDVVLVDARMPVTDGFELARSLRATSAGLRMAILSAMVDETTHERARAVGVDACVSKGELARLGEIVRGLI